MPADVNIRDVWFFPIGSHNDGLAIAVAQDLVDSRPAGATKILIQALDQNARYTLDGTNPTATRGFQLRAGDPPVVIPTVNINSLKIIEEVATCDLQFQWGK